MFSLNLLKRALRLFLLNLVTSGLFQVGLVACQHGNDQDETKCSATHEVLTEMFTISVVLAFSRHVSIRSCKKTLVMTL